MDSDEYRQLPIPEWLGLACPKCEYPLRGLPEHRCPECGWPFDIDDLITAATPLHPPRITPAARPVPDLGLTCEECGYPLRGLPDDRCPECGEPFDLADRIPPGEWVDVPAGGTEAEAQLVFDALRAEGIPCVYESLSDTLTTLYGLRRGTALRVPHEYYLDVLRVVHGQGADGSPGWICGACGEEVPGNFEVCWKCQSPRKTDESGKDESR